MLIRLFATVWSFQFPSTRMEKELIKSKDETSVDTPANTSANSRNINLSYILYLKYGTLALDSITPSKLYWKLIEIIQVYPSARHKFSDNDCKADTTWKTFGDTNMTRTDIAGSQQWTAVSLLLELISTV